MSFNIRPRECGISEKEAGMVALAWNVYYPKWLNSNWSIRSYLSRKLSCYRIFIKHLNQIYILCNIGHVNTYNNIIKYKSRIQLAKGESMNRY